MFAESKAVVKSVAWALIAACPVVGLAGCQDRPAGATSATSATVRPTVYGRQEFRDLVMGKTPDEVIKAVGRPDTTSQVGSDDRWYYRDRTRDPVTGKVDMQAMVVFRNGVADEIAY